MADQVTMTALDTVHISNVRAENLAEGDVFNVSETEAKRLEDAGIAKRGGKASDAVNVQSAAVDNGRDALDEERGFIAGKAIGAAPANKAMSHAPEKAAATTRKASRK